MVQAYQRHGISMVTVWCNEQIWTRCKLFGAGLLTSGSPSINKYACSLMEGSTLNVSGIIYFISYQSSFLKWFEWQIEKNWIFINAGSVIQSIFWFICGTINMPKNKSYKAIEVSVLLLFCRNICHGSTGVFVKVPVIERDTPEMSFIDAVKFPDIELVE